MTLEQVKYFNYFKKISMAIDILQTVDIIEIMENYLEDARPPEEIRKQLDIGYRIEDQSVLLTVSIDDEDAVFFLDLLPGP